MKNLSIKFAALSLCLGLFAGTANAVPVLQLGIAGGTYDSSSQTIVATSQSFSLYAYLYPKGEGNNALDETTLLSYNYFLSMAVTPQVSSGTGLGSFTINGEPINVTDDMVYGNPAREALLAHDPGDLAPHGIFPTYFTDLSFKFNPSLQSGVFNTQDNPSLGPQAGTGMYYQLFNINTANLAVGSAIHFDLYSTTAPCIEYSGRGNNKTCVQYSTSNYDINLFAPFSHDAQSAPPVPEPESYALLLAGLGLLGLTARRRKQHP